MRSSIIAVLGLALLTGCMKEELPVPARERAGGEYQFCLGGGYQQQLWMDMEQGEVVAQNSLADWDLAFESGPDGWRIMLNGGRLMLAWNTGASSIDATVDVFAVYGNGLFDGPTGHPDSTAFGDWRGQGALYVVDMGYDGEGNLLGQRRVRPLAVDASSYTFEVALANGSEVQQVVVPKDPQRSWVHYRFGQGVVQVAPPNGQWDFVFTRYTYFFESDDLPYLVVGALIDGNTTRVARLTGRDFASVTLADTAGTPFERRRDIIGYDWKEFSFDTNAYTVDPGIVYIVQDADGLYYKLHFLDYYGSTGQAGCPRFAIQPL